MESPKTPRACRSSSKDQGGVERLGRIQARQDGQRPSFAAWYFLSMLCCRFIDVTHRKNPLAFHPPNSCPQVDARSKKTCESSVRSSGVKFTHSISRRACKYEQLSC